MKIHIINGPNLNWLGQREVDIYGNKTLADLEKDWQDYGEKNNISIVTFQSNSEGAILDYIYETVSTADGYIINAGALTHYSHALRDCIGGIDKPVIEVHISNPESREAFRHTSVISPVVVAKIAGFGTLSYELAMDSFIKGFK